MGGWQFSSGHSTHPEGADAEALRARGAADLSRFASAGLAAVDFGDIYSGVEVLVGRHVRAATAAEARACTDGGGGRSALRLHTKLVPDLERLDVFSAEDAREVRALLRLLLLVRMCTSRLARRVQVVRFARHCGDARRETSATTNSARSRTESRCESRSDGLVSV